MAVGVCAAVFLLTTAAVAAARGRLGVGGSVRETLVAAATLCGGYVLVATEGLGAVGRLRFAPVLACWVAAAALVTAFVAMNRRALVGWCVRTAPLDWPERGLLATILAVVGAAGVVAVACPPNNYDVTLYHLPRQWQWLQQGSVAHFPTQDYRLTVNPPFAEFVGLHLLILSGTDRLATVESWAAMVLTLLAVSLVGRELGLSRKGQLLAALFACTVPVGFHEAVNGKNDWTVAFWLAVATFWVVRVWKAERVRPAEAGLAGLSLGLLVLTKGTGGVYAVPLVLLGGLGLVLRRPRGWAIAAVVVGALAVAPNVPHWSRNMTAYGSVGGKTFGLANDRHDLAVWASGVVRNVGMHLAGPRPSWNRKVERAVRRVHGWLGVGADDPVTTWAGVPFAVEYRPQQEDFATAPVHALLLLVALPASAVATRRDRPWLVYWVTVAGGFLLFSVVFKWQPWHPRLHLPVLALGGVAVGWLGTRRGVCWVAPVAVTGLVLSVVPAATRSDARSLGPGGLSVFRHDADGLRYFGRGDVRANVAEVVARTAALRPRAVDLINNGPEPWEYTIMTALRGATDPPRVGYFYPVAGSPAAGPPADVVIDVASATPPDFVRHPQTWRVYRVTERVGTFTLYRLVPVDAEYGGYRLTDAGEWETLLGWPAGPPPVCDHPVARFGIGTEPAAATRQ